MLTESNIYFSCCLYIYFSLPCSLSSCRWCQMYCTHQDLESIAYSMDMYAIWTSLWYCIYIKYIVQKFEVSSNIVNSYIVESYLLKCTFCMFYIIFLCFIIIIINAKFFRILWWKETAFIWICYIFICAFEGTVQLTLHQLKLHQFYPR